MINRLHISKTSSSDNTVLTSGKQNASLLKRLLPWIMILILLALLYWVMLGRIAWRDYHYAHASLSDMAATCSKGEDLHSCAVLMRRAIEARHTEVAVPALQACWDRIRAGSLSATTIEKADIIGNLSLAAMLSGRQDEAPSLFDPAMKLDYGCVPAHIAYSLWLTGRSEDARAMHELQIATTLEPRNDLAWFLTAHILDQNNRLPEGLDAIQKALAINPSNPSCWQELGDNYGYSDRQVESLKAYQEELKRDPNSLSAQADVARALSLTAKTKEQYKEAVRRVQAVIDRKPNNLGEGYMELGELHLTFGDYRAARNALEIALKDDATIPELHYKLARARRLSGDIKGSDEAMHRYKEMYRHYQNTRTLQKSLGEKPNDVGLHLSLAKEWEYYQSWNQAGMEYQSVLRLIPAHPEATRRIAELKKMIEEGRAITPHSWVLERLLRASRVSGRPAHPSSGENQPIHGKAG